MKQARTLKSTLHALWRTFPWLWLAARYLFDLWYHIVPGKWIIDSDLAAEMQLAELLNQENSILHQGWYYSTELRVFHMQWFYRLGLLLFPDNWHAARTLAMAVALLVLVALYLFFAHAAGFARLGVWTAALQLWPFGRIYLFLCIYGGYYFIYTMFTFLVLGCLLHSMKSPTRPGRLLWLALAGLPAAASGLNGVRQLMVLFAPLVLASLAVLALSVRRQKLECLGRVPAACGRELWLLGASLAVTLASLAGYLVNQKVLSQSMHFALYNNMSWSMDVWGHATDNDPVTCLLGLLNQFGYEPEQPLFSFGGIASAVGLLLGAMMLLCVVRLLQRFGILTVTQQLLTALTVCAVVVNLVVFVYLEGNDGYSIAYWLPVIPLLVVCLQMEAETETFHLKGSRRALALCVAAAFTFCSVGTVQSETDDPLRGKQGLAEVCDWLLEHGYREGYALFWSSHAMIELTSHQLDVWTVNERGEIYQWLEPVSHTQQQPGAGAFLLLDWYEGPNDPTDYATLSQYNGTVVYEDGRYTVYELQNG